jgi:sterol desaturase/sphingolipid hydroxylase (fatty acid hydroxylase superfamily)
MNNIKEYVIVPSLVFWITYMVLGVSLELLKQAQFYKKYLIPLRKNKNANLIKWSLLIKTLVINSIFTFLGTFFYFWIIGFPNSDNFGIISPLLRICTIVFVGLYSLKKIEMENFIPFLICLLPNQLINYFVVEFYLEIWISLQISKFIFFHLHYLFHIAPFLKAIHSIHHKNDKPSGIQALDCHVLELLLFNLPSTIVGVIIVQMCPFAFLMWSVGSAISTVFSHDGHIINEFLDSSYHDYHHSNLPYKNFGMCKFWDWIYGTHNSY